MIGTMFFQIEPYLPDGSLVKIIACGMATFCMSYLIHKTREWHIKFSADARVGVQSVHQGSVPRIGGAGLAFGLLVYLVVGFFLEEPQPHSKTFYWAILFSLMFYLIGVCEDISKDIRPTIRLGAMTGAAIVVWLSGIFEINRILAVDLDQLVALSIAPLVVTVLCLLATVNAVNMIDGLNGLASGIVGTILTAFAYIAFVSGDYYLLSFILTILVIIAGFLVFNWPLGLLFLGDGGAYLLGSVTCFVGISLANRNDDVSYITVFLCMFYLVSEITGSVFRRFLTGKPLLFADDKHLHSILFKKLKVVGIFQKNTMINNNLTSLCLVGVNAGYLILLLYVLK